VLPSGGAEGSGTQRETASRVIGRSAQGARVWGGRRKKTEREAGGVGTESGDEAGGGDDGLLDDEDLELVHHAHGCCCCCSAIPLPSSFVAVAKRTVDYQQKRGCAKELRVEARLNGGPKPKAQSPTTWRTVYYLFTLCPEGNAPGIFGQRWRISSGQSEYFGGESESTVAVPTFPASLAPHGHPSIVFFFLPLYLSLSEFIFHPAAMAISSSLKPSMASREPGAVLAPGSPLQLPGQYSYMSVYLSYCISSVIVFPPAMLFGLTQVPYVRNRLQRRRLCSWSE
jgi:hypothetical protein